MYEEKESRWLQDCCLISVHIRAEPLPCMWVTFQLHVGNKTVGFFFCTLTHKILRRSMRVCRTHVRSEERGLYTGEVTGPRTHTVNK